MTSNTLPYVLCDHVTESDTLVHRSAFRQRIAFTHLTVSYSNDDISPYNTRDLAAYLSMRMEELIDEDVKYKANEMKKTEDFPSYYTESHEFKEKVLRKLVKDNKSNK